MPPKPDPAVAASHDGTPMENDVPPVQSDAETIRGHKLIAQIAQRVKEEHVAAFGVIVLIFLFSVGSAAVFAIRRDPLFILVPFGSLLVGLGAVVYLVVKTRIPVAQTPLAQPQSIAEIPADLPHGGEAIAVVSAIASNLRKALASQSEVFRSTILTDANEFRAKTENWAQYQMDTAGRIYNAVLIQLYSSAKRSVFSTSMPDYLATWLTPLGDRLLEAHGRSEAEVTRIFIFDSRSEITEEAIETMHRLSNSDAGRKMNLRVWIDDEDPAFHFPAALSRDFTIIDDGVAVGITLRVDREEHSARWFFGSEAYTRICRDVAENIRRGSIAFSDFSAAWKKP